MNAVAILSDGQRTLPVYRQEKEVSLISLTEWLYATAQFPRFLWGPHWSGKGCLTSFFKTPTIKVLKESSLRLIGWRHFLPTDAQEWRLFPPTYYCLPCHELFIRDGKAYEAVNSLNPNALFIHNPSSHALPKDQFDWLEQHVLPDKNSWSSFLAKRPIDKVVLARRVSLKSSAPLDPFAFVKKTIPTFFFQMAPHIAFFGKPPEKLYRRTGRQIESDAVAGTQPLWSSHSKKDHLELSFVERAIEAALHPLCTGKPTATPLAFRISGTIHHLHRIYSAILKEGVSDEELLKALHPTPAVAGWPPQAALTYLQQCEPFQRGLYAAPVGWISGDSAEWLVALRSALVDGNTIHLYSGAGLVEGSEIETEWEELDRKLEWFLR